MHHVRASLFIIGTSAVFFACGGSRTVVVAPAAALPSMALREQTADQQTWHVLSRLTFGARPGDVERVRAIGPDRWIDDCTLSGSDRVVRDRVDEWLAMGVLPILVMSSTSGGQAVAIRELFSAYGS